MKIGIDIGGSHIGVGLVEGEKITDIVDKVFTLEEKNNMETILAPEISNLISVLLEKNNVSIENIDVIGIACPGTISNGVIVKSGNLGLYNFELISKLSNFSQLGIKLNMRNDGKCAALAEKNFGALKSYNDALFVNIGTGIGGAAFLDGKLLEPQKNSGFEFGHMVIEKDGNSCSCGKRGCFETYCSIKALKKRIVKTLNLEGKDISGKMLREEIMPKNKEELKKDIDEYLDYLVLGIGNLIDIFEPEVICFGGSFSYYEEYALFKEFKKRISQKGATFNNSPVKFIMAELKNDAGIIGSVL